MIGETELMAYADGELEGEARTRVEQAIAADPELGAQVERHRRLRRALSMTFDPVLEEPVPLALRAQLSGGAEPEADAPTADVVDLGALRAARARREAPSIPARPHRLWGYGLAAAAVAAVAVMVVRPALLSSPTVPSSGLVAVGSDGITAKGALDQALDRGLASAPQIGARVRIGLTFRDRGGRWCRTFAAPGDGLSGLACRSGPGWRVEVLQGGGPAEQATFRTAGSGLPASVRAAVDQGIAGDPADANAERRARDSGWN